MTNIQKVFINVNIYDDIFFSSFLHFRSVKKELLQKKIGQRVVELRTKKGWTQSDLARACNKDRQAIERLESGKANPTLYSLSEIAKGLEISIKELVDF